MTTSACHSSSAVTGNARYLPVMPSGKQDHRDHGTDESHAHIRLCIPLVALCAKKFIRTLPHKNGRPPFDQFIPGTNRHRHADGEEGDHFLPRNKMPAHEYLLRHQCGHQSLP